MWENSPISSIETDGRGGSLMAPTIVLTAAHCIATRRDIPLSPQMHGWGLTRDNNKPTVAKFATVAAQKSHPEYNGVTVENDVMRLRVFGSSRVCDSCDAFPY
jgi:secreted trypsin-like serine protease